MTGPEFTALLADVRGSLDEAARHVDALGHAVETVIAALPPAAAGTRVQVIDLHRNHRAIAQQLGGLQLAGGDPAALRAAGAAWVGEVAAPVSGLVAVATDAVLSTDDQWTGVAADAYRGALRAQQSALAAIVTTCQDVDATLDDLASAITTFWLAVATACLGLVLALAGALGTAATAVGAPAAAGIALAGVGALVAAGDEALSGLTKITTLAAARSAGLHRRLVDSSAFPHGAWPRSTTGLNPRGGGWQMR